MPPCPSFPCWLSALRTRYHILYAEVSRLMTTCKAATRHKVLGLSSCTFIQCFCLTWELHALPSSYFGWYHPRFPDPKLLETLANSHSCQRHRLDTHRHQTGTVGVGRDSTGKCSPVSSPLSQQPAYKWQLGSDKAWGFSPPSPSQGGWLGPLFPADV